jgi:predicted regulator of Ras-like GTPase activity (Roadblock/LC7/MglB family)
LTDTLAEDVRQAAATLLAELDGAVAVLIVSAAGRPLAQVGAIPTDVVRLAAAGRALVDSAQAIVGSRPSGALRSVYIEAGTSRVVVRRVQVQGAEMIALVLADPLLPFGLAASRIGQIESTLIAG